MITRNFKSLLGMVLQSASANYGVLPLLNVNGKARYCTGSFNFPFNRTATATTSAAAAGISIGSGSAPASEADYNLENTISSGVSLPVRFSHGS